MSDKTKALYEKCQKLKIDDDEIDRLFGIAGRMDKEASTPQEFAECVGEIMKEFSDYPELYAPLLEAMAASAKYVWG